MAAVPSRVTARLPLPYYLVRERENVVACPLEQDGSTLVPASGTGTLYDSAGNVVHTAAVAVVEGVATYTIPAVSLPNTYAFGPRWRVEFSLTAADGRSYTPRNPAFLCRSELYPVIGDDDLYARQSALDPSRPARIHSEPDFQAKREEAWVSLIGKLWQRGSLPHMIAEPSALRESHLCLTLAMIYEDFATRLSEAYSQAAADWRLRFEQEFSGLSFLYDADENGVADERKRPAQSVIFLTGTGRR